MKLLRLTLCLGSLLVSITCLAESTHYPLTIHSCNREVTFKEAPRHALSHDINMTQMMLALGLKSHMVGYSGISGWKSVTPQMARILDGLPELAAKYPSVETLLNANVDFFFAGWDYGMRVGGDLTPQTLAPLGINVYELTESCAFVMKRPGASLDDTYNDLRNLGRIFDVQDRAEALIAQMQARVATVQKNLPADRPRVFLYDSGEDRAMTSGRLAMPQALIEAAGGRNVPSTMMSRRYPLLLLALGALLLVSCVVSLGFGPARLPVDLVGRILAYKLLGSGTPDWNAGQETTLFRSQAVTRNPLADPHLLGVTSGATLGAVIVVLHVGEIAGLLTLPIAAFIGALGSMLAVLAIASRNGRLDSERLLLCGVAVSFVMMALANLLSFLRSEERRGDVLDARRPRPGALGIAAGTDAERALRAAPAAGHGPLAERADGRRTDRRDPGPERTQCAPQGIPDRLADDRCAGVHQWFDRFRRADGAAYCPLSGGRRTPSAAAGVGVARQPVPDLGRCGGANPHRSGGPADWRRHRRHRWSVLHRIDAAPIRALSQPLGAGLSGLRTAAKLLTASRASSRASPLPQGTNLAPITHRIAQAAPAWCNCSDQHPAQPPCSGLAATRHSPCKSPFSVCICQSKKIETLEIAP